MSVEPESRVLEAQMQAEPESEIRAKNTIFLDLKMPDISSLACPKNFLLAKRIEEQKFYASRKTLWSLGKVECNPNRQIPLSTS